MKIHTYIQAIQIHLIQTHTEILHWFEEKEEVKNYRPADQGWTISEILEHIALTSHFLLILISKGTDKALRNVHQLSLEELLQDFDYDLNKINEIGIHKSFAWIRPEHMEPSGEKSDLEIKDELINQLNRCLNYLEKLKNGEGLLYKTTMTVNELGKINVYEYFYFLSKHAERHIQQMEENKKEFERIKVGKLD
ncbi:MAG: DinB family protein [Bacteroidia bacterium]